MPNFTINVNGTNYTVGYDGTFNSPQGLLPALNNLGFGIFWIEEIGGSYVLTTVDNDDVYGDAETNADPTTTSTTTTTTTAAPIPTTTSTTTTTTAAPTTSTTTTTTTAAATSTTTTTTTAAPTTSTTTTTTTAATTSTTTTTTSAIATLYVDLNGANACSGIGTALPTYAYSGGTTLCDCTSLNAANATSLSAGTYFVSDGVNRRQFTSTGSGSPTLTAAGTCSACPIVTTSTTTTTTTLPPFTANIATTDAYDACNAPELSNIVFYGNGLNACDSTSVVMDSTLAAYLSDGQTFYINDRVDGIFYSSEWLRVGTTTTANRQTACDVCPAPITSTTTTTTTTTSTTTTTTTLPPFTANISTTDAYDACNAPELTDLVFYGNGLDACDSTSVTISATLAAYLSDGQIFFISDRVSGIFYSNRWTRVGSTLTATRNTACDVCPPATTTSTTTTTSTLAGVQFGVSLNTRYGTDFLACAGTVTGVVYQKAEFGSTPTVGAQLYTSSTTGAGTEWTPSQGIGLYLMQFGGSTKWSVLVGNTGLIDAVTSCAGVSTTTTTTTTTLPPITVTATASCDGIGLSGQGRVTASSFSGGSGSYTVAAIGTSEANAIACVNNPSCPERVSIVGLSSYAWTSLANGPYYVAIKDTVGGLGYSSVATVSCNVTTTTSTTTTTTTLAGVQFGVSLNTKYGNDFLACAGTVTGVVYQKAEFGNTPTVGAQLYTSSTTGAGTEWTPSQGIGLYLMQFGGSTKWSVLVGTTGLINAVTSCAGVSTTTTTTTLPPISVTATPSCDGSGFSGQGRVTASGFSGGSGSYTVAAIGTSEANAIACVNNPACAQRVSIVGLTSYAWTSLANGPYYVAIKDTAGGLGFSSVATVSCNATTTTTTTSTSSTTTSSTTTTTTSAPTNVWLINGGAATSPLSACSNPPFQYVWTYGNAYGAGITYYADNGSGTAPQQPIQPFQGGGYYYANGGFVLTIDDNGNSANYQACPITTTTTPAPTFSQYRDCANNPYYTYNFNTGDGTSSEVVDNCVFYQGETSTPTGTFFTDFTAGSGCPCP